MAIQFDAEITLDEDYLEHNYESYDTKYGEKLIPSVEQIIRDALNDIWESHRFGVSLTAKNVRLVSLHVGDRSEGRKLDLDEIAHFVGDEHD